MKKLYYIPIVHNQTDLGSFGSDLSMVGERKYGTYLWRNHLKEVDKSWERIRIEIDKRLKNVSFEKIKIYQDGLPAVGDIGIKIVKEVAEKGSKNYKIIDKLLKKGAKIETAESKDFLCKEYYLLSGISRAEKQSEAYAKYKKVSKELLIERDTFIANQINVTLNGGETGIAFFGAAHSIIDKINKDIDIVVIQMFKDDISLNLMKNSRLN